MFPDVPLSNNRAAASRNRNPAAFSKRESGDSERHFRSFADRLPIIVWQQDACGRVVFTNAAWHRATGLPPSPLSYAEEAWAPLVHPDDFTSVLQTVRNAIASRSSYRIFYRLKPAHSDSGTYRWYIASAIRDVDDSQQFVGWTGYTVDIDESQAGNIFFREFFNANIIGMLVCKVSGEIIDANDEFLRMTGYARTDVDAKRMDWRAMTPPEWNDADARAVEQIRSSGHNIPFEKEYLRKDGSRVPVLIGVSLLPGSEELTLAYALDLSSEKAAEHTLAESNAKIAASEKHLKAMADAVPLITWTAAANGALEWYNAKYFEYTGQTPQEAAGWGWQSVHHPDDFPAAMNAWTHSLATGKPFESEFRMKRFDGEYRWFLTRAHPYCDEAGRVVRWYGTNIDINEQKQTLERSARISEMLQRALLPDISPGHDGVRIDSLYLPAEDDALVGGDWFDARQLADGRFLCCIGDVAGHGVSASTIAARLRHAIIDFATIYEDPAQVLSHVNGVLRSEYPDTYVTAVLGFVHHKTRRFAYSCAGHPPPILSSGPQKPPVTLPYGGPPLGVHDQLELISMGYDIGPDTLLTFYTDGLIENDRDAISGEARLLEAAAALAAEPSIARPAAALARAVLKDARPTDDVAILVVKIPAIDVPASADTRGTVPPNDVEKRLMLWRFHSSDAYAARMARHEVVKFLRCFAADANDVSAAETVIGELLANTVQHAQGLVDVEIDWQGEKPLVRVRDSGPGLDEGASRLPYNPLNSHGRGMLLVRSLAESVAVNATVGNGTEVCVTLRMSRQISG